MMKRKTRLACAAGFLCVVSTLSVTLNAMEGGQVRYIAPPDAAQAETYKLDTAFYKKCLLVQNILIATSERVSEHALREAAYQFHMVMKRIKPEIAERIRGRKVLCILIGHDEFTSDLPQFTTDKTGKELDFYNWRQRGFLTNKNGLQTVVFAEEDVLEYEGGMQLESILIHEFGHVIQGAGFDKALQDRLTECFESARAEGIWMDGRAAQRLGVSTVLRTAFLRTASRVSGIRTYLPDRHSFIWSVKLAEPSQPSWPPSRTK